jgi:hypothetical protein
MAHRPEAARVTRPPARRREAALAARLGLIIFSSMVLGSFRPATASAREDGGIVSSETGLDYRMPVITVRGERLTIDEVITRAARVEEEARRCDRPRRFTSHIRLVAVYGNADDPGCKREIYEEVSRVEEGPGPETARSFRLWENLETWQGDSLVKARVKETDRRRVGAQIEQFRRIPLALRRGLFHYRIMERRKLPDQSLIHVAYRPREDFAPYPAGEAWIDTRSFVVMRQTGSITRNVPLPFLVRSVDGFSIHRSRYGPVWIEDEMEMRIALRGGLGTPDRVEFTIRLSDVSVDGAAAEPDTPAVARGPDAIPADPESVLAMVSETRERAVIDSIAARDRSAADPFLYRPSRVDFARASSRGDSLLGDPRRQLAIRPYGPRPVVRYDRAQRLTLGAGVRIGRGRGYPTYADLEAAYSNGLRRGLGHAILHVEKETDRGFLYGFRTAAADQAVRFAGEEPFAQIVQAFGWGTDERDAFGRREIVSEVFVGQRSLGRIGPYFRLRRDRAIDAQTLWSVFRGNVRADRPFRPISAGTTRIAGIELRARGRRIAPWMEVRVRAETGDLRRPEGGDGREASRALHGVATAQPILPGGRRLDLRGIGLMSDSDLPLQDRLYLGGEGTLRGYKEGTLAGRKGYHVGGELFLNRDVVGWLPGVPDRGLGLEAFIAGDFGRILEGPSAGALPDPADMRAGTRGSAGFGFAWTIGIPEIPRVLVGIHHGLDRRDRGWSLRITANPIGIDVIEGNR